MDCLVCHDTTDTYKKPGPAAGVPAGYTGNPKFDKKSVDLVRVAQNVGAPSRDNCISCHGYGGGGNNVKHGDNSRLDWQALGYKKDPMRTPMASKNP